MCKWGTIKVLDIPAHPSWKRYVINGCKKIDVDSCIADIVQALNDSGISTIASCCGHNHGPGIISLQDGRQMILINDMNEALNLIKIARERGIACAE